MGCYKRGNCVKERGTKRKVGRKEAKKKRKDNWRNE
jgi:hypothetical protein